VDFVGSPLSGISPLTVSFTDQSTNSPNNWAWDFTNNGTFDNDAQNPTYTYENPGLYSVRLVASNAYGSGYNTKIDYIEVLEPPPIIVESISSPSVEEGLTLEFQVELSGTTMVQETYSFSLGGGTASASDYGAPSFNNGVVLSIGGNNIIVPTGVSSFIVSVPTIEDAILEANETVILDISGVTGTGTILNNDIPIYGCVTLDFEGLPLNQPVGNAYASQGFEFTGDNTVKDDTLFSPSPIPPSVQFISSGTSFIVYVVDPNATPFNSLNFDYVGALDVSIFDTVGGMTSVKIDLSISPDWQMLGDPILLDKSTRIERVEFVRSGTTSFGLMGIDNLSFCLQPGSIIPLY
jgi:hypothetical protein